MWSSARSNTSRACGRSWWCHQKLVNHCGIHPVISSGFAAVLVAHNPVSRPSFLPGSPGVALYPSVQVPLVQIVSAYPGELGKQRSGNWKLWGGCGRDMNVGMRPRAIRARRTRTGAVRRSPSALRRRAPVQARLSRHGRLPPLARPSLGICAPQRSRKAMRLRGGGAASSPVWMPGIGSMPLVRMNSAHTPGTPAK